MWAFRGHKYGLYVGLSSLLFLFFLGPPPVRKNEEITGSRMKGESSLTVAVMIPEQRYLYAVNDATISILKIPHQIGHYMYYTLQLQKINHTYLGYNPFLSIKQ